MQQSEEEDTSRVLGVPEYRASLTQNTTQNRPKPPFKLCFGSTQEIGRSDLSKPHLPGRITAIITPKFYSVHDKLTNEQDAQVQGIDQEMKKAREVGPKEKYQDPLLESHRYGWFRDKFVHIDEEQDKFYFPRKTSDMVKIQSILHNASKAEKLFQQYQMKNKQHN